MSVRPAVMRRLMRELTQLKSEPPEGIRVSCPEDNMLDVTGIIEGPSGTPYEGGYFKVKFKFNEEFPESPPKCWFATKIFHPNVSTSGEICVNTLKKDWQPSYGIGHILVTVKCLLIYPNPESALDEEAGKLLLENYESYCDRARLITKVHATPKVRPAEFCSTASQQPVPSTSSPESEPQSLDILTVHTLLQRSSPPRKSVSPSPALAPAQAVPLQSSNTLPSSFSKTAIVSESLSSSESIPVIGDKFPLGKADSNSPSMGNVAVANTSKAMKRPAGAGSAAAEKRKKALKRL